MKALAFGEILWDVFEGGRTLGGAPLNVLGHIRKLGGEGCIVSALGDDELGALTRSRLEDLGIGMDYLSTSDCPTGYARIQLVDGVPGYSFCTPAAWDRIRLTEDQYDRLFAQDWDVLIYGTLAQRDGQSAATLERLLSCVKATEFFFDVNLRLDYYGLEAVERGLKKATIVKMNDEEVPVIASLYGQRPDSLISWLIEERGVSKVLVTSGKRGSDCYSAEGCCHADCAKVRVVDTVGAGDSLSAAFLHFLSKGCPCQEALERASMLADYVVGHVGAIPDYDDELRKKLGI